MRIHETKVSTSAPTQTKLTPAGLRGKEKLDKLKQIYTQHSIIKKSNAQTERQPATYNGTHVIIRWHFNRYLTIQKGM